MGGQAIPRDGTAITFDNPACDIDTAGRRYRAHAGARWHEIIKALDKPGFSPAVMQSNHDFGLAGTLSVNAHGWPAPFGPFAETVRSFRLMLADGSIVNCSRGENAELFSLVAGGYGLYGIVLDAEVDMVENALLKGSQVTLPSREFGARFATAITDQAVRMAYGRLSISEDAFCEEALLITYRPAPLPKGGLPAASSGSFVQGVSQKIFRAQVGSERWKRNRWRLERRLPPGEATRNTLMNEPVAGLGRSRGMTDILHEYFVPPEKFAGFIDACRAVIPGAGPELLNVTLRWLEPDKTSVLAYAPEARIAAVMLFVQPTTKAGDDAQRQMTEKLIERVLALGGSYYLPYRLHATRAQMERAYPRLAFALERKRHYDPDLLFRNMLWDHYFA
jgi:FAD/FMN-containing dehydrogenase